MVFLAVGRFFRSVSLQSGKHFLEKYPLNSNPGRSKPFAIFQVLSKEP